MEMLMTIIAIGISLYLVYYGGEFVDMLINTPTFHEINKFIVFFSILSLVLLGLNYFVKRIERMLLLKISYSIINDLLIRISRIPLIITNKLNPIELNQRINYDVQTIITFFFSSISQIISNMIIIIITVYILYKINIFICLIIACLLLFYFVFYMLSKKKIAQVKLNTKNKFSTIYSVFQKRLSFLRNIKLFNLENIYVEESDREYQTYYSAAMKEQNYSYLYQGVEVVITMISQIALYLIGGMAIINGELSIGMFTILFNYFNKNIAAVKYFVTFSNQFLSANTSYLRIKELLQMKVEKNGDVEINNIDFLKIENLSFRYDTKLVLDHFNVEFKKSNSYCIVGDNGAGKTTLVDIISGLYTGYYDGEVFIDNCELNKVNTEIFRENVIGYVEQKPIITTASIKGLNSEINEEIRYNILSRFGLNTQILTNNIDDYYQTKLSGGELQKIAIANEFSKQKQVLILDEPTSMLDRQSKRILFDLISEFKQDKLIIIISHDKDIYNVVDKVITM